MLLQVIVWQILHRERTKWHYAELLPLENNLRPEIYFLNPCSSVTQPERQSPEERPRQIIVEESRFCRQQSQCHPLDNKSLG